MNTVLNNKAKFIDLGRMDYQQAWDYQTQLFNQTLEKKRQNAENPLEATPTDNYLLFCEHPHVFTLGKSGKPDHLLIEKNQLNTIDAKYYHINRGGDITYHGPGQLVVYPVIDLENFFTDIHKFMRLLEESVIRCLAEFGIIAGRIPGLTGVWVGVEDVQSARKICALGVKTSRWVTLHGLALNVNTNLSYFDYIVPCGIQDKAVTSMEKELNSPLNLNLVGEKLKSEFEAVFGMELI